MESACNDETQGLISVPQWSEVGQRALEASLSSIVQTLQPSHDEHNARADLVSRLKSVILSIPEFVGPEGECLAELVMYGSYVSGLYNSTSDMDIMLTGAAQLSSGRVVPLHKLSPREAVRLLHSISRNLQKHQIPAYDGLSPFDRVVACARVPLIHFIDRQTNIDCDVCLCNHAGVFKSRFTALLAGVDDRLGALYRVVKLWTCQHGLNDPKAGTLNSWSIMQLVIFHLQSCQPAVLPPIWQLFNHEPPTEHSNRPLQALGPCPANAPYALLGICQQHCQMLKQLMGANPSSLSHLLLTFFKRYSTALTQWLAHKDDRQLRLCTWYGRWREVTTPWRHPYLVSIEDPFDSTDNTARTLGTQVHDTGAGRYLLEKLQEAEHAMESIHNMQDVRTLMTTLFGEQWQSHAPFEASSASSQRESSAAAERAVAKPPMSKHGAKPAAASSSHFMNKQLVFTSQQPQQAAAAAAAASSSGPLDMHQASLALKVLLRVKSAPAAAADSSDTSQNGFLDICQVRGTGNAPANGNTQANGSTPVNHKAAGSNGTLSADCSSTTATGSTTANANYKRDRHHHHHGSASVPNVSTLQQQPAQQQSSASRNPSSSRASGYSGNTSRTQAPQPLPASSISAPLSTSSSLGQGRGSSTAEGTTKNNARVELPQPLPATAHTNGYDYQPMIQHYHSSPFPGGMHPYPMYGYPVPVAYHPPMYMPWQYPPPPNGLLQPPWGQPAVRPKPPPQPP
eukprot:jgi/Chrzof1/15201/Cz09g31130.t1